MANNSKYDCDKNPANIPRYFKNKDHMERIIENLLSKHSEYDEQEVRLATQCDDLGLITLSLDENIDGYSDNTLIQGLLNHLKHQQKK